MFGMCQRDHRRGYRRKGNDVEQSGKVVVIDELCYEILESISANKSMPIFNLA
jgi:hypothetical protein